MLLLPFLEILEVRRKFLPFRDGKTQVKRKESAENGILGISAMQGDGRGGHLKVMVSAKSRGRGQSHP